MQDSSSHHDHNKVTHSKGCDEKGCEYVAKVHAHDDETAAMGLSQLLAEHNKEEHDLETEPKKIKEDVQEKMKVHS